MEKTQVQSVNFLRNERGAMPGWLSFILSVFVVLTLGTTAVYGIFGTVVPPNAIGVRINYFSFGVLNQGYSKEGLSPGLHLRFPGVSEVVLLQRDFQFINFNAEITNGDLDLGTLQVQSRNGPWINADVTWVVRLFEGTEKNGLSEIPVKLPTEENPIPKLEIEKVSHGGPADLITFFGADKVEQLTKFSRIAQNELSKSFNELYSSDFYNPILRESAALKAGVAINREVNPFGMQTWATLVRRYMYQKEEIDIQIFQKNLQTQTAKLRVAQTALAEVSAQIERTIELWNQKIREKNVEAQNYLMKKQAEARYVEETKVAEGEKELKSKTAEITGMKNKLLAEMAGADAYIAREMVPLLKTLRGGVLTSLDPYDVDRWIEKLLGQEHKVGGK